MKIAFSSVGTELDNNIDSRFGRCSYFIVVDSDSGEFEAFENPAASAGGGAGIQAAQSIVDKGANVVLTGNCGPNAFKVFDSASVDVITGVSGKISDALAAYKSGELTTASGPSAKAHAGMRR